MISTLMEIISFLDLHTTYVTLPPAGQGASGGPYTVATNAARLCLDEINEINHINYKNLVTGSFSKKSQQEAVYATSNQNEFSTHYWPY